MASNDILSSNTLSHCSKKIQWCRVSMVNLGPGLQQTRSLNRFNFVSLFCFLYVCCSNNIFISNFVNFFMFLWDSFVMLFVHLGFGSTDKVSQLDCLEWQTEAKYHAGRYLLFPAVSRQSKMCHHVCTELLPEQSRQPCKDDARWLRFYRCRLHQSLQHLCQVCFVIIVS